MQLRTTDSTRRSSISSRPTTLTFVDFVPLEFKDYNFQKWTAKSFYGIRHGYCWTVKHLDQRRLELRGRGANMFVHTGLELRANQVPGAGAPTELRGHPHIDVDAAPSPDDLAVEPEAEATELALTTREFQGWRTSFMMEKDEGVMVAKRQKHLLKGIETGPLAIPSDEALRHRPMSAVQAAAVASGAKHRKQNALQLRYERSMAEVLG
jgi:hypothetical protein